MSTATPVTPASDSLPTVKAPILVPAPQPSSESLVLDVAAELRAAVAALKGASAQAELSAELTMSRKSARRRLIGAVLSVAISAGYLVVDVLHERSRAVTAADSRLDALEQRLDAVAEDVAAIARAVQR